MTEITKKEFDELYGDVEVEFSSYYKYTFNYRGQTDDFKTVSISFGGCADDIYKQEVEAGEKVKVKDIEGTYATVYENDDCENVVHSYYEGY